MVKDLILFLNYQNFFFSSIVIVNVLNSFPRRLSKYELVFEWYAIKVREYSLDCWKSHTHYHTKVVTHSEINTKVVTRSIACDAMAIKRVLEKQVGFGLTNVYLVLTSTNVASCLWNCERSEQYKLSLLQRIIEPSSKLLQFNIA